MPYPSQVDRETIIAQARELIETHGLEALSLSKLAANLGIKAPSLYNHIGSKTELLRAVNALTYKSLVSALDAALHAAPDMPADQFVHIALAYRAFAFQNPHTYILATTNAEDDLRPDEDFLLQLVLPLQAIFTRVCGPERSLPALRGAYALIHGFVMLELTRQLRRGGDLEAAYIDSCRAYMAGWAVEPTA